MSTTATVASPVARGSSRQPVNQSDLEQFFANVSSRLHQVDDDTTILFSHIQLDRFFRVVGNSLAASEKSRLRHDKKLVTGFNVFHFIEPDENRLSDVLAFLFNPKDTHGQGDRFLRLMFSQLGLVADAKHTQLATVRREASTDRILNSRRRIDILVEAGAWLAIENKIDSSEQPEQVKDEPRSVKKQIPISHSMIFASSAFWRDWLATVATS